MVRMFGYFTLVCFLFGAGYLIADGPHWEFVVTGVLILWAIVGGTLDEIGGIAADYTTRCNKTYYGVASARVEKSNSEEITLNIMRCNPDNLE